MPKISIIIPIYNVDKYLDKALTSVINQSLEDIEIICINDASPDNSYAILEKFQNEDSRIKVITLKENKGAGNARNIAINLAEGDYIMFLDPDDWLEPEACEIAYNQISKNKNDFVYFGMNIYNDSTKETSINTTRLSPFMNILNNQQIKLSTLDIPFIKTIETVYKIYDRNFINRNFIRFSEEKLGEDVIFTIKSIISSNSVSVINRPLYNYRIHNKSATKTLNNQYIQHMETRQKAFNIIKETKNKNLINAYITYYINSTMHWYEKLSLGDPSIRKDFYKIIQQSFKELDKNYDIEKLKTFINYKKYKRFIKNSYAKEQIKVFLQSIFSIQNLGTKKIIQLFGFKLNINRHIK